VITSPHNEKLRLVRKLHERRHREREGLFLAEGEDLVEAAAAAGVEPELVLVAGEDIEPELLDEVSSLGSGTRVIGVYPQRWSEPSGPVCVYLHGVGDPGNVGAIVRSAHALAEGCVALGPDCADPYSPKAVRASMGSVFAVALTRSGIERTPQPRVALVAHGGVPPRRAAAPITLCLGSEREGLPAAVASACSESWTIPLRAAGAESLNVAMAATVALYELGARANTTIPADG
jgi:TrmH family RNA methyltransferase